MNVRQGARPLEFPVRLTPYAVAQFHATRVQMRGALGDPHFIETDPHGTAGGDEDSWAWELPAGQRILLVLAVPYADVTVFADPAEAGSAVQSLGIDAVEQQLELFDPPILLR